MKQYIALSRYESCTVSMNLPPVRSSKAYNNSLGMCLSTLAFSSVVKPEMFGGRGITFIYFEAKVCKDAEGLD